MIFIIVLLSLLVMYAITVSLMRYMRNVKIANLIFFELTFGVYIVYVFMVYSDVGAESIYFHGVLATANISPFMFSMLPIVYILRGRIKQHLYLLISLLSVGMLISPTLNAVTYAMNNVVFHIEPLLDYVAHLTLSLFGIYLVRSGQVTPAPRKSLYSGLIIIGVALFMMVLNLIFDTSFFGLSLLGKHNIYGNVLVESSYLSALIYFAGLTVILLLGYACSRFFEKRKIG